MSTSNWAWIQNSLWSQFSKLRSFLSLCLSYLWKSVWNEPFKEWICWWFFWKAFSFYLGLEMINWLIPNFKRYFAFTCFRTWICAVSHVWGLWEWAIKNWDWKLTSLNLRGVWSLQNSKHLNEHCLRYHHAWLGKQCKFCLEMVV